MDRPGEDLKSMFAVDADGPDGKLPWLQSFRAPAWPLRFTDGLIMRLAPLALALALCASPALADDAALNRLIAEYEAYSLGQNPVAGGDQGDRAALSLLPDNSPAADARRAASIHSRG